jgi:hypothetical protein
MWLRETLIKRKETGSFRGMLVFLTKHLYSFYLLSFSKPPTDFGIRVTPVIPLAGYFDLSFLSPS